VAEIELNLIILHRALIVLNRSLILQHQFFLVVQQLLLDGIARPCGAVALKIHLSLGKHVFVSLQSALSLQEIRLVGARINVNQRIPLPHQLTLLEVHSNDQAIDLAGNRIGIDGSDRTDRIEVYADISFLSRRGRNRDFRRSGRDFFPVLMVAP
jgi:hypothetical protein